MNSIPRTLAVIGTLLALVLRTTGTQADAETVALLDGFNNLPRTNVASVVSTSAPAALLSNVALRDSVAAFATTDLLAGSNATTRLDRSKELSDWQEKLEVARRQRLHRLFAEATPTLVTLILTNSPEEMKRTALLELAIIAQEENNLPRAQQIFAHYLIKWPDDLNTPEVILRQGLIFRQMGLNNLALTKFYAVMTSSLVLKADQLEYYQRLVLQAQTEIAETFFQQGKLQDSVEFFTRLLKQDSPFLNKPQIHFKLVRSLSALGRFEETTAQAFDFLGRYSEAVEQPEVRFYLATALKRLGRNNDSLQQVLLLLEGQLAEARIHPETWAYWQQRTGNEIANQLYKEGDYLRALEVYSNLSGISTNVDWQLPVWYQIGLTYERLQQPVKALGQYAQIVERQPEVATNAAPNLLTILDMARWRQKYLGWQTNAEIATREFKSSRVTTPELSTLKP